VCKHSASCDIFITSPNGFVEIAAIRHVVFEGLLSEGIDSDIGLSSEMFEILLQRGGEWSRMKGL
jgi:hypothetical protein